MGKAEALKKAFDRRKKLDDGVDEIVAKWREIGRQDSDELWEMVIAFEKEFEEAAITIYPGAKLTVKIHDGIQSFT